MAIDRKAFFDRVRASLFAGKLLAGCVAGLNILLGSGPID